MPAVRRNRTVAQMSPTLEAWAGTVTDLETFREPGDARIRCRLTAKSRGPRGIVMVFEGWATSNGPALPGPGEKIRYQQPGEIWVHNRTQQTPHGFVHVPDGAVMDVTSADVKWPGGDPGPGPVQVGRTAGELAGEILAKSEAVARVQALELPEPSDGLKSLISARAGELGVDVHFERILDEQLGGLRWQVRMRTPRGDVKQPVMPIEGESADVTWERACEQLGLV